MEKRYIVLQYPLEAFDVSQVHDIFHMVSQMMKPYCIDVIAIPECIKWYEMSKEELEQVKGIIDWVLEKRDNDTNSEARTGIEDSNREVQ